MDKKLINIVKGDINTAILNGSYNRNTAYQTNIEFNTPTKLILLDGDPYSNPSLTKVTWQELKDLRDNNKLIAGSLYRITDYQCTTTQENTRSAGHQFDIVLLALSTNKLAEEGWAMEHPTDVYDVTFYDGFTKKCYLYVNSIYEDEEKIYESWNLIDIDTMLGIQLDDIVRGETAFVDNNNKQISFLSGVIDPITCALDTPDLTYNYFQNSNLSAWKVWYCLDNDTTRFAWADDRDYVIENVSNSKFYRSPNGDITTSEENLYCWDNGDSSLWTKAEKPKDGDAYYDDLGDYAGIIKKVGADGRGVIYRLIDEYNNDIKYDFKNIQFKRKITDGQYDATNGTDTWCYTLNIWYNDICQDASIVGNTIPNDEGYVNGVYDNKFGYATAYDLSLKGVSTFGFALGDNIVLSFYDANGYYYGIYSNTIGDRFYSNTIGESFNSNTIRNNFHSNTIGNGFESNTIGNAFNANTIGNGFCTNIIGTYFSDNTIGDDFNSNIIGNSFGNKTISDSTSYKNYGNNGVELATKNEQQKI